MFPSHETFSRLQAALGLPNRPRWFSGSPLPSFIFRSPLYSQFGFLSNLLTEPHLRQGQTGLTTFYFARHEIPFLDYRSPLGGQLWNEVHELPLYQWICARLMNLGLSLEVASRGVGLAFFLAGFGILALILRRLVGKAVAAWAVAALFRQPLHHDSSPARP